MYWDASLAGFGVRIYPSGRIAYVVQSRGPRGSVRVTLGRHGPMTTEAARKQAAGVIGRIKAGEDPLSRAGHTVRELAQRCLRRYVDRECKPSTAARYRQLLRAHIVPALGEKPVGAVERDHIAALVHELRGTRGTANNVLVGVLETVLAGRDLGVAGSRARTRAARCGRTGCSAGNGS